ncbi:MAG: hypothetical protein ABIR70_04560 [Bryobacteraceae bacterium]
MKLSAAFVLLSSAAFAAAPIGVATASGQFRVEGSRIWGNSTLFDGAKIETSDASSELSLSNGVKIQLAADSSARVWKGRLELERGSGQVTASSAFLVNAGGVSVQGSRYRVGVMPGARLEVAALIGSAKVLGSRGDLLAAVPVGRNMNFAMQQPISRAGCLVYKGTGFILQVEDSPEVLQLTGGALAQNVGNRVQVTGTPSPAAATIAPAVSILNVSTITQRAAGGCLTIAAALNAQTTVPTTPAPTTVAANPGTPASSTPTVARTGMSTGAKVGIIAAIGGGGAGAALALGGKKSSTSP